STLLSLLVPIIPPPPTSPLFPYTTLFRSKLNIDPVDLWVKNLSLTGPRQKVYEEEFGVASELMGWKQKWRPRGQNVSGNIARGRSEEHTSELQSPDHLVCRLLLEKQKNTQ